VPGSSTGPHRLGVVGKPQSRVIPQRDPLERSLVGPAGEHFVLYKLYRLGLLAALAPPGVPEVDILILDQHKTVRAGIQVKTRTRGTDRRWHMSKKHEDIRDAQLFYAFVDLQDEPPVTYLVPSSVVAQVIHDNHRAWLDSPGARGQPHRDTKIRRIAPTYNYPWPGYEPRWLEKYRDDWGQLAERAK
jgi:hypothetical protein